MSADVLILPRLDDPFWVAWQASTLTALHRRPRGALALREHDRTMRTALTTAFNRRLDQWHRWDWDDALGGLITLDRNHPANHPYLGVLPNDEVTAATLAATEEALLRDALEAAAALLATPAGTGT